MLSVVFALAATLAAFAVYLQLTGHLAMAFAAAALFAVHPIHSEAVDRISALPDLGCALFFLIAFGLFLSQRSQRPDLTATLRPPLRRWGLLSLSLLAFAVALLWKETAVVFPVMVAAYALCLEPGDIRGRLRLSVKFSLPYWCVLFGYLALRIRTLGFLTMRQRNWELTPVQVGLTVFHLVALYWLKLIAPIHLNAYYVFSPVRSILDKRAMSSILLVSLTSFAIWYGLRRASLAAFAALWVFITLLPAMSIYALGRNVFAERYLYLPSVGFCLLAAVIVASITQRLPKTTQRPLCALLLVAVVVWFSWETFARNPDWHDDATLFRKTLEYSSDAPFVHFMVAATENDDSAASQTAESHYLRAIDLAQSEKIRRTCSIWPGVTRDWHLFMRIRAKTLTPSGYCTSGERLSPTILNWMPKRALFSQNRDSGEKRSHY